MKNLLTLVFSAMLALAGPSFGQCGDDDIGSLPAKVKTDTVILISEYGAGVQWWTETEDGCKLAGLIVSPSALAGYVATGDFVEPGLDYNPADDAEGPPVFETSWTCGGLKHTVRTPKPKLGDSTSWAKKHATHVDALQKFYPPDPADKVGKVFMLESSTLLRFHEPALIERRHAA